MPKGIKTAAFLLVLAAPPHFQSVNAQQTSRQLWRMSRPQATEQSLRDLTALLSPTGVYPRGYEGILFRDGVAGTDFLTRPYGTYYPGICARDILTLHYAHVHDDSNAADRTAQPVGPYHVSVRQEYAFVRQPAAVMLTNSETGYGSQFRPECADIGPSATWFSVSGDDPQLAAGSWLLFQNALRAARAGTLGPVTCATSPELNSTDCMQLLESLSDYRLLHGVAADILGDPHHCRLSVGDYVVTITTTRDQNAGAIWNGRVSAISVAEREIVLD